MSAPESNFSQLFGTGFKCQDAIKFKNTFEPSDEVDYDWILDYAKDQYDHYVSVYRALDEKGSSIVGYLGGGAGLLMLGALTAVSAGQIHPLVILYVLPSVFLSLASLCFAAKARQANWTVTPPSVEGAVLYAEYFQPALKARAAFLGQWYLSITVMREVISSKAWWVNRAIWLFVASVVALVLPLAITVLWRSLDLI